MEYMSGKDLEDTLIFQDYITDILHNFGWSINCYSSRKYNIEKGESLSRIEIKQDKKLKETGNFYFEVYERQKSNNGNYVESGILRKDNTMLIIIGDYEHLYLFSKKQIQAIIRSGEFRKVQTDTSIGYLIPVSYFEKHKSLILAEWENGKMKGENNE